jgi:hypothetical protein
MLNCGFGKALPITIAASETGKLADATSISLLNRSAREKHSDSGK